LDSTNLESGEMQCCVRLCEVVVRYLLDSAFI
jgi:hypothetical protein